MFNINKYPQSIFGAIGSGFKLCVSSFPKVWYWLILSALAIALLDGLGDSLTRDPAAFMRTNGLFNLIALVFFWVIFGTILSAYVNYFICKRMHVVAIGSKEKVGTSAKWTLKKIWPILGVIFLMILSLAIFWIPFYIVAKIIGNPLVVKGVLVLSVLSFIYLNVSLFFSDLFILFDGQGVFKSIKSSFVSTHKYFWHVFIVVSLLFFVELIIVIFPSIPGVSVLDFFISTRESQFLKLLGGFVNALIPEFLLFLSAGVGMSIFYNLKAKDGLSYSKIN